MAMTEAMPEPVDRAAPAEASDFVLRGEFIPLDALLKATGLAESGGRAKQTVAEGRVRVDGQVELRKTAKLRAGQVVEVDGMRVRVMAQERAGLGPTDAPEP